MRNKRVTACFCAGLLLFMVTGCGKSGEYLDVPKADVVKVDNAQMQSDIELDGDIESIGDNRVVINEVFHPSENVAVSYGEAEEKVLITAYFSEETKFEVWTIKNGGVNGDADIEKRQGTFSDLKQDTYISMTGSYSGNDFHAKQVIIHYYI